MQASSLLLPDRSFGELDLQGLSDQTLMEIFVDDLTFSENKQFKDANGDFKDVCKWEGIECNGRRRVVKVELLDAHVEGSSLSLYDFWYLPPLTKSFAMYVSGKNPYIAGGSIDTASLPRGLRYFFIPNQRFDGTFDFRRLPPAIEILSLRVNQLKGTMHLAALPSTMKHIAVTECLFTGSIMLTCLPDSMRALAAGYNKLHGSIDLSHLLSAFEDLSLAGNAFTGTVCFDWLPPRIHVIDLRENKLSGEFILLDPPDSLERFDAGSNNFVGTAVIAQEAYFAVGLDGNDLKGAVDEFEQPCDIPIFLH